MTFVSTEEDKKILKDIEENYKITISEFPSKIEENELCMLKRGLIVFIYVYMFKEVTLTNSKDFRLRAKQDVLPWKRKQ